MQEKIRGCGTWKEILPQYPFYQEAEEIEAAPHGDGHINDTLLVTCKLKSGGTKRYILQRINTSVFRDPDGLMENIHNVTSFLRKKIAAMGGDPDRETVTIVPNETGGLYCRDQTGGCWRVYRNIEGAVTYQTAQSAEDFRQSAMAFGRFRRLLEDYPAHTLHETIPHFHDTPDRFRQFTEALDRDVKNRAHEVQKEIDFVLRHEQDTHIMVDLLAAGELPLCVTHNDTKLNNVMLDEKTKRGLCVVDLDTVMPGLSLYDYGDSIRFGASTAEEDERDLSKVELDLDLYNAYTEGYLEAAGDSMTAKEIEMMPMGAKIMTLECGMRFLTDYLSGDTYFKIHREGHNLDRARTQFKLVEDMERKLNV